MPKRKRGRKRARRDEADEPQNEDTDTTQNNNNNNSNNSNHNNNATNNEERVDIKLFVCFSAHKVGDKYAPVSAPTMHQFAKYVEQNELKTEEKDVDIDEDELPATIADMLSRIEISEDNKKKFRIKEVALRGKRFDEIAKFTRTNTSKDRQWNINQGETHCKRLNTTAGKNKSHWLLLGSDTETKANLKKRGGSVKNNACSIFMSPPTIDTHNDVELNEHFLSIWDHWNAISNVLEARSEANTTDNVAVAQHELVQKLKSGEITQQEFITQQQELTAKLFRCVKRNGNDDDDDYDDDEDDDTNNE